MFKKLCLVWIVLLLTGCANQLPSKNFYQLPDLSMNNPQVKTEYKGIIFVQPITLADLLDNSGIVYQLNDVQYSIANQNLWSQPLSKQLVVGAVQGLSQQLPDWLVLSRQVGESHTRIVIKGVVSHFNGRFDGMAEVKGGWIITYYPKSDEEQQNGAKIIYLPFDITVPQQEAGYSALVNALAQAWQQNIDTLATTIKGLNIQQDQHLN